MSEVEGGTATLSRVVIVPGNGCTQVRDANWYGWLEDELAAQGSSSYSVYMLLRARASCTTLLLELMH